MKIISWNVNGIRAWSRKGGLEWLLNTSPDILCLQETKAHPDQLEEGLRNPSGYFSYFDHSKMRKGYSGVAVFTKIKPEKVEYGLGIHELDQEGRFLSLFFKDFVLITCYFPNGGGGPERLDYKMRFYAAFTKYCQKLRKSGHHVVFCGDVNTAHHPIDLARPKENEKNTGFLPQERAWIDDMESLGYVDTFRSLHPDKVKYSWWDMKTFARERNVGWRLDYFFVNKEMFPDVKKAEILDQVIGSDHCPVILELV